MGEGTVSRPIKGLTIIAVTLILMFSSLSGCFEVDEDNEPQIGENIGTFTSDEMFVIWAKTIDTEYLISLNNLSELVPDIDIESLPSAKSNDQIIVSDYVRSVEYDPSGFENYGGFTEIIFESSVGLPCLLVGNHSNIVIGELFTFTTTFLDVDIDDLPINQMFDCHILLFSSTYTSIPTGEYLIFSTQSTNEASIKLTVETVKISEDSLSKFTSELLRKDILLDSCVLNNEQSSNGMIEFLDIDGSNTLNVGDFFLLNIAPTPSKGFLWEYEFIVRNSTGDDIMAKNLINWYNGLIFVDEEFT